jgi:hypothetical protein
MGPSPVVDERGRRRSEPPPSREPDEAPNWRAEPSRSERSDRPMDQPGRSERADRPVDQPSRSNGLDRSGRNPLDDTIVGRLAEHGFSPIEWGRDEPPPWRESDATLRKWSEDAPGRRRVIDDEPPPWHAEDEARRDDDDDEPATGSATWPSYFDDEPPPEERPQRRQRGRRSAERDPASQRPLAAARQPGSRPSGQRIALVSVAVVVGILAIWVRLTVVGAFLGDAARVLVGQFAYVLPLLPLALLMPLPRDGEQPFPWARLRRAGLTRTEMQNLTVAALVATRDRLFTRATGVVVALLGLLHLLRGAPSLTDGGFQRGGGVFGWLIGEPLRLVFGTGGGIALLFAVLACAGLVTTAYVTRAYGRNAGYGALAAALAIPLIAATAAHWVGFNHYLAVDNGRVVVVAGLAAGHRHDLHDTGIPAASVPTQLRGLLDKGIEVDGRSDGERIAKAFAKPSTSAVESFQEGDLQLKVGDCFDWIGGSSQLRYSAPCNGAHVGEVFFVGKLPFKVDPGKAAVDVASRAMCELPYSEYLGVPYGSSYLPVEEPFTHEGGWQPEPVIACWVAAVGPWALKGSRTVGALQQTAAWAPGDGCKVTTDGGIRITAEKAGTRCVAPGTGQPMSVEGGAFVVDTEFAAVGRNVGEVRIGVACLDGTNFSYGYTFLVTLDGTIELHKQLGGQSVVVTTSGKPRNAGPPPTASTPLQVVCQVTAEGVSLRATSSGGRVLAFVDKVDTITKLSPRLILQSAEVAPVAATLVIFSAAKP